MRSSPSPYSSSIVATSSSAVLARLDVVDRLEARDQLLEPLDRASAVVTAI